MLVSVRRPVAVSAIRQFSPFSAEVFVLADRGRDFAPRDARTERGGINLQPVLDNRGDQNPERIQIQFDGTLLGSTDYPEIKVGDRLGEVTGVVGYSFGNFEVNALDEFPIKPSRIQEERSRPGREAELTVASYNVLNRDELAARGVKMEVANAFDNSRDPLEAVFRFRGEKITVINNHFSSRFGSTPIFGGPQPFEQAAEDAREAQSLRPACGPRWKRLHDSGGPHGSPGMVNPLMRYADEIKGGRADTR